MFAQARLKLTMWYLITLLIVSGMFSAFIYQSVSRDLEKQFASIETRFEFIGGEVRFSRVDGMMLEHLLDAKQTVFKELLIANLAIAILGSIGGWILAGFTLRPIEKMLESQKRFVADASHELRTPLTALQTEIEVGLRSKKLSIKEAKTLLQSNLEEINRLRLLTNRLLDMTNIQAGRLKIEIMPVDVNEVVRDVVKSLKHLADQKGIKITVEGQGGVIDADEFRFMELITILLDNAIKYTPEQGTVGIKLSTTNKVMSMQVWDTGHGIAKVEKNKVFTRFYRTEQSRTSQNGAGGFGLGLSLANEIVSLHHGSIKVSDNQPQGSIFTICLPIEQK